MATASDTKTIAAFFDIDQTVIKSNSGAHLAWFFVKQGKFDLLLEKMTPEYALKMLSHWARYKVADLDYETMIVTGLEPFKGMTWEEIEEISHDCFDHVAHKYVYKDILNKIAWHRKQGHKIILLTAGFRPLLNPFEEFLEADDSIGTEAEFKNGVFQGRMVAPYCIGEGKGLYGERYAKEHGIDLSKSYFYTDSIDDISFMEKVGKPVAVNPDWKLWLRSVRSGWPIMRPRATLGNK